MIKKLVVFVVMCLVVLPLKVFAGESDSYVTWELDMGVVAHQIRNDTEHMTNLALMKVNDKIAYCIEPGVVGGKDSWYSSSDNINDTILKNVDVKKLSLIGYYGYGYNNHNTKEYYMATQELIWRLMGVEDVWWTDKKYDGNVINIDTYKNEILSLVNSYEITPNFNFMDKYIVGDEIILNDTNNVLEGYEVMSGDALIDGNNITIKVSENTNFTLKRKVNGLKPIYYYKDGFQTIGTFEYAYDFEKEYTVKSEYGKMIVDKYDNDTKSKTPLSKYASLEGATYAIYKKDGTFIKEDQTDQNGMIIFDKLPKGTYIIKEVSPSLGYQKEVARYETYLSTKRMEAVYKAYEKIVKEDFVISKVYEDGNLLLPEEGTIFGIYDDENNLISENTTDKDGKIYITLPYGKYILKQITTKEGYNKVEDTLLNVKENKKVNEINLVNKKVKVDIPVESDIKELPNTYKNISFIPFVLVQFLLLIVYKNEKENS